MLPIFELWLNPSHHCGSTHVGEVNSLRKRAVMGSIPIIGLNYVAMLRSGAAQSVPERSTEAAQPLREHDQGDGLGNATNTETLQKLPQTLHLANSKL